MASDHREHERHGDDCDMIEFYAVEIGEMIDVPVDDEIRKRLNQHDRPAWIGVIGYVQSEARRYI